MIERKDMQGRNFADKFIRNIRKYTLGQKLRMFGSIWIYIALFVLLTVYPLYVGKENDGMATGKFLFLLGAVKYLGLGVLAYLVIRMFVWGFNREEIAYAKPLHTLDICMLVYTASAVISYAISPYKQIDLPAKYKFYQGAKWGTSGWFLGLYTLLICVSLYFVVSRMLVYCKYVWIFVLTGAVIVMVWGILNRYGIYPKINGISDETHIATIGNINWFCGYVSVFAPIMIGLYWGQNKARARLYLLPLAVLSFFTIFVNGSDSGVFALIVVMLVLFAISCSDAGRLMNFFSLCTALAAVLVVIAVIDRIWPGLRNYEGQLSEILIGIPIPLAAMVVCLVLTGYFRLISMKMITSPAKLLPILRQIAVWVPVTAALTVVILIVANTLSQGRVPIIGDNALFIFNDSFASNRGVTWTVGVKCFESVPVTNKIFGIGPDCMCHRIAELDDVHKMVTTTFGKYSRLTNAHNELLTLLVNQGIVGMLAFAASIASAYAILRKRIAKSPELLVYLLMIVSYIANNMFSFQQITSTPLLYIMLGVMGANVLAVDKQ